MNEEVRNSFDASEGSGAMVSVWIHTYTDHQYKVIMETDQFTDMELAQLKAANKSLAFSWVDTNNQANWFEIHSKEIEAIQAIALYFESSEDEEDGE